jgi:hypothetical protein
MAAGFQRSLFLLVVDQSRPLLQEDMFMQKAGDYNAVASLYVLEQNSLAARMRPQIR